MSGRDRSGEAGAGGWGEEMGDMGVAGIVPGGSAGERVTSRRVRLAASLVLLNTLDVLLTRGVLDRGGYEMNPLMRDLMVGLATPLALKVAVSALAGALLLACPARSRVAEPAANVVVGLYAVLVAWNAGLLAWLALNGT